MLFTMSGRIFSSFYSIFISSVFYFDLPRQEI
jgi:hypothetical protein